MPLSWDSRVGSCSGARMASLFLIRHGQTSFPSDRDRLSIVGEHQARLAAGYLQSVAPRLDHLLSGSLARQKETASVISAGFAKTPYMPRLTVDARLNEADFDAQIKYILPTLDGPQTGQPQHQADTTSPSQSYQRLLKRTFLHWQLLQQLPGDLETWHQFSARVQSVLEELRETARPGATTIVVTSGGVIATVVQQVLRLPDTSAYALMEVLMNCSVTHLLHDRERFSLASFNDCSYLATHAIGGSKKGLLTFR